MLGFEANFVVEDSRLCRLEIGLEIDFGLLLSNNLEGVKHISSRTGALEHKLILTWTHSIVIFLIQNKLYSRCMCLQ